MDRSKARDVADQIAAAQCRLDSVKASTDASDASYSKAQQEHTIATSALHDLEGSQQDYDRLEQQRATPKTTSGPSAVSPSRYPAAANGILTSEGLRQACGHVWRDSNSITMLGADVLNSEPVSYDDKQALMALKRHIAAAGPRAFVEDVLPHLGFGPIRD